MWIRQELKFRGKQAFSRNYGCAVGVASVSYTHLDVYKRQMLHLPVCVLQAMYSQLCQNPIVC